MSRITRQKKNNALSRIGKIKVGELVNNTPRSLDYFRCDSQPMYKDLFFEEYGEKPQRLEILFISDNTDDSCSERWELRKKGRLWGYSQNREYFLIDKEIDAYKSFIPENEDEFRQKTGEKIKEEWKVSLTLNFILPRIRGVIGFWSFTTHGESSSIPEIVSTFDWVLEKNGTVEFVPFDLVVEKVKSQKPDSKSVYPVVKLIPNISANNVDGIKKFINEFSSNQIEDKTKGERS
jgi:hypothetical protein